MRTIILLAVMLGSTLIAVGEEVAVPLDSTGKIFVITTELENKLGLFPDYAGFLEARMYRGSDGTYVLEVLEQTDSSIVRKRIPQTQHQVDELRKQVSIAISQRSPQSMFDQSGRGGLIVNSAILSAGFYGWSVPVATKADGSGAAATYFFVTALGVLIPYFASENANVTRATAMMDFYGGSRGIAHGVALYYATDPRIDSERAPYGWATLVSIGERLALNQWAAKTNMTEGKAAVIGVCGDFGLGLSAALAAGHDLWNGEHQSEAGTLVLGGSLAGMIAGTQLADHGHYTRGDAYVLRGVGILGAAIPAAIADATDQNGKTAADLAIAGSVLGLGVGDYLLRNRDFTNAQGLTVLFVEFGVATLATAAVIAGEPNDSAPFSMAAAFGGAAGFALGYANASRSARTIRHSEKFDFQINPLPLMTELPESEDAAVNHRAHMAVHISYTF